MNKISQSWKSALTPADTREIWEWAEQEGELPTVYAMPGKLDIETCPMIKEPFRALRSPIVRSVTSMSGVQCLKTLLGEIWLLWLIANDPGPTQWLQPTDEEAKEHAKERFLPLIGSFPAINRYYTEDRFDAATAFIRFQHMFLRMEGCGKGNVQRKSIKNQMRSEVWQVEKWPIGRLKEASSRLTQFVHNSKDYTESQPGWDASYSVDDMHGHYLLGTQEELQFNCLSCGKAQPFAWEHRRADGTFAAMRWDETETTRRESGEWRWGELKPTIRYECIHCGSRHYDDPITRRRITSTLHYKAHNPDVVDHRSFTWNQLAMPNLSWFETKIGGVKNYLSAMEQAGKGNDAPLMEFWMKVIAAPYNPAKHAAVASLQTVHVITTQKDPAPIVVDGITFEHRLGACDVQEDWFRVVAQAYSARGDDITLEVATAYSWDDVSAFFDKWCVPPKNVSVDVSHRGHEVKIECCKHGDWVMNRGRRVWRCWRALKGDDQDWFTWNKQLQTGKTERVQLPYSWPAQVGNPCATMRPDDPRRKLLLGKTCEVIAWSNPTIKDVVINRRDGRAKGIKSLVANGEWNDLFNMEMHSQKKVQADGKYGGGKWKWVKFRGDHTLDCVCMNTVRAFQLGLLSPTGTD